MIPPGRTEGDRLAAVEIGGDQEELVGEFAEVVGPTGHREQLLQEGGEADVVEDSGRYGASEPLERGEEPLGEGICEPVFHRLDGEAWDRGEASYVFGEGRLEQDLRIEGLARGVVLDEHRMDVARREAVRQTGGEHTAGGNADVDVAFGERHALQRILQSDQRTDLVDGTERTAPRQSDTDLVLTPP